MIFGDYPCCGGPLAIPMAHAPSFEKEACPHCGATVWHRHSRIEPASWTEADFLAEFVVDEVTREIRLIKEPSAFTPEEVVLVAEAWAEIENQLLNGTGTGEPLHGLIPGKPN